MLCNALGTYGVLRLMQTGERLLSSISIEVYARTVYAPHRIVSVVLRCAVPHAMHALKCASKLVSRTLASIHTLSLSKLYFSILLAQFSSVEVASN